MMSLGNSMQLKDVYDLAYEIAQEFDNIRSLDIAEAKSLILKVIHSLELLEDSVERLGDVERENLELKTNCMQLSCVKEALDAEKLNLKLSFEEMEETWVQESISLKSLIQKLKAENRLLQINVADTTKETTEAGDEYKAIIEEQDNLINRLKTNLKEKDRKIDKSLTTVECLNSKVEQLLSLNRSLHFRYQEAKSVISAFKLEKRDHGAKLNHHDQKIVTLEKGFDALRRLLHEKNECKTLTVHKGSNQDSCSNETSVQFLVQEQVRMKQKVSKLESELSLVKRKTNEYRKTLVTVAALQNQSRFPKNDCIQQIFRLFLGVLTINPQIHWFM